MAGWGPVAGWDPVAGWGPVTGWGPVAGWADTYRVVHVCHLQEVFGAPVLVHFNGFSAPFL